MVCLSGPLALLMRLREEQGRDGFQCPTWVVRLVVCRTLPEVGGAVHFPAGAGEDVADETSTMPVPLLTGEKEALKGEDRRAAQGVLGAHATPPQREYTPRVCGRCERQAANSGSGGSCWLVVQTRARAGRLAAAGRAWSWSASQLKLSLLSDPQLLREVWDRPGGGEGGGWRVGGRA